jgi:hypothetical protein
MEHRSDPEIAAIDTLIDRYRDRCLWFLRPDYRPATDAERLHVLAYIERYGDLEAYRQAARLKRWLLQSSNAPSAE